jgi:hypothetical protein
VVDAKEVLDNPGTGLFLAATSAIEGATFTTESIDILERIFMLQTMMTKIIGFASGAPSAEVKKIARRASAGGDSVAAGGTDSLTAVVRMARMAIIAVMDTTAVWDEGADITCGMAI